MADPFAGVVRVPCGFSGVCPDKVETFNHGAYCNSEDESCSQRCPMLRYRRKLERGA